MSLDGEGTFFTIHLDVAMRGFRIILNGLGCLAFVWLVTGCSTGKTTVDIRSYPTGANVSIDGRSVGTTPMQIELETTDSHRVTLTRNGFQTQSVTIAPSANERSDNYVKFGLLDEVGYYQSLAPNPVEVELLSTLLPTSRGIDAYANFSRRVLDADQLLESGAITTEEHRLIIDQLIAYFQ